MHTTNDVPEPTGPAHPTLITQILDTYPGLQPTTDPETLLGRMLTYKGDQ